MRPSAVRTVVVPCAFASALIAWASQAQTVATSPDAKTRVADGAGAMMFHIPAQPLDKALLAFGLASHVQVLYEARLISGQRSTLVDGRYLPGQALEILLRGTGLHVRYVSADAITIAADSTPSREVLVMRTVQIQATDAPSDMTRFEAFGRSLEQRLLAALRGDERTRRRAFDVTLKVWLDAHGMIVRTELEGSLKPDDQMAIAAALRDAAPGPPPPPDLPQPISFRFQSKLAY